MVLAVAECGSISAAATKLFMSVQGLKKALDQLEREELGCELFIRTNKGVTPTEAGKAFCSEAPALLAQIDNFVERIKKTKTTPLRISIWDNKEIPVLDTICAEYCRLHPEDPLVFVPANARRVLEDVAEGLADITFQSLETGMVNQDLLTYSSSGILMGFRCVMAPSHPLASREPLDLEDLLSCPVTIVGDYGNGTSTRLSSYIGITTTEVIPYERYRIMSCCLQGGACVCDEYLASSLAGLVAKEMPWVTPTEILIAHRPSPSIQVRHFIEATRKVTARSGEQSR